MLADVAQQPAPPGTRLRDRPESSAAAVAVNRPVMPATDLSSQASEVLDPRLERRESARCWRIRSSARRASSRRPARPSPMTRIPSSAPD